MNAAKMLVWVMSGLLIALLAVLVVGLSLGWHKDESVAGLAGAERTTRAPSLGFDLVDLDQPAGTSVAGVAEVSGWVAVTLSGGGLPDRVVFLNPSTSEIEGEIVVNSLDFPPTSP